MHGSLLNQIKHPLLVQNYCCGASKGSFPSTFTQLNDISRFSFFFFLTKIGFTIFRDIPSSPFANQGFQHSARLARSEYALFLVIGMNLSIFTQRCATCQGSDSTFNLFVLFERTLQTKSINNQLKLRIKTKVKIKARTGLEIG